jgi:uroporphyrinogen III methyltransferase/synthase
MLGGDSHLLDRTAVAAIGPITAAAAEAAGLRVAVVARQYTIPGLVDALSVYFGERTA